MNQYQTIYPFGWPSLPYIPPRLPDDIDIINFTTAVVGANPGPPGPQGPAGPPGPPGPAGECSVSTRLVSESYQMVLDDCYVGVQSTGPVTITLPLNPEDGQITIVKVEMQAPIGNKKVMINTGDSSLIDGKSSIVLQNQWESRTFIFRGDDWYTIS